VGSNIGGYPVTDGFSAGDTLKDAASVWVALGRLISPAHWRSAASWRAGLLLPALLLLTGGELLALLGLLLSELLSLLVMLLLERTRTRRCGCLMVFGLLLCL